MAAKEDRIIRVTGSTFISDGSVWIIPYSPRTVGKRMDLALRIRGSDLPLHETYVAVDGLLEESEQVLRVIS